MSGVEALPGETEAAYVARQTRERDEAAARMRAKFGTSGGLNGKMGGYGPSGYGGSGGGGGGGGGLGLLSSLGSFAAAALESAAEVTSSGAAAAAIAVSSGLEKLPVRSEISGGFGREPKDLADVLGRGPSRATSVGSRTSSTVSPPSASFASDVDEGGVEPLPGETDAAYAARQARLREVAAERMRAKFGASNGLSGKLGGCGPSDVGSQRSGDDIASMLNGTSLSAPAPKPAFVPPVTATHSSDIVGTGGRVKKVAAAKSQDNWDDFEDDW